MPPQPVVNQCTCVGPECEREAAVRHPRTGEPLCQAHYQQARLHPERPLRPLRRKRRSRDRDLVRCRRCGQRKPYYAKGLCRNCYMAGVNRRHRQQRQTRPKGSEDEQ